MIRETDTVYVGPSFIAPIPPWRSIDLSRATQLFALVGSSDPTLRPRFIPFRFPPAFGAHSDAQGFGHISASIRFGARTLTRSVHLPAWVCALAPVSARDSGIFAYELAAAVLCACMATDLCGDRFAAATLCVDNSGALQCLIRGNSSTPLGRALVAISWNVGARANIFCWFEWVSTLANFADRPSRACGFDKVIPTGFGWRNAPDSFLRIFASFGNFSSAVIGEDFRGFDVESGAWGDCVRPAPELK